MNALPFWPRYLTREQAAAYLGVSVDVFDDEVRAGLWPAARRRGAKGGKLTWDKSLLDLRADQEAGLAARPAMGAVTPPDVDPDEMAWMDRINGKAAQRRT
jgi:hypothetical protein